MSEEGEDNLSSDISDYGSSTDSNITGFEDSLINLLSLSPSDVEHTNHHKECNSSNNYIGGNSFRVELDSVGTSDVDFCKEFTDSEHLTNNGSVIVSTDHKLLLSLNSDQMNNFRELIIEVNNAYSDLKLSEFLINSYKSTANHIQKDLATTLKGALKNNVLPKCLHVKNTNSKMTLFGLPENELNVPFSKFNMSLCKKHTMEEFKLNFNRLIKERDVLMDATNVRVHYQKIVSPECPLVSEQKSQQICTYNALREDLEQSNCLIKENNNMMGQLLNLKQNLKQRLENNSYSSLSHQAKYLNIISSIQKLKVDKIRYQDKDQIRAFNTKGADLKEKIVDMRDQLKSLQSKLKEYERKENLTKTYHNIVSQYAKTQKILNHKQQTLILLRNSTVGSSDENDTDVTF